MAEAMETATTAEATETATTAEVTETATTAEATETATMAEATETATTAEATETATMAEATETATTAEMAEMMDNVGKVKRRPSNLSSYVEPPSRIFQACSPRYMFYILSHYRLQVTNCVRQPLVNVTRPQPLTRKPAPTSNAAGTSATQGMLSC